MASDTFTPQELDVDSLKTDKDKSRDLGRFHLEKVMMSKFKVVDSESSMEGAILEPWWGDLHGMEEHTEMNRNVVNMKVFEDGVWNGKRLARLTHASIIRHVKEGKLMILDETDAE